MRSKTSVSICRPPQSLKPPGGRSSKVMVKRNVKNGSFLLPVLGIAFSLLADLDAVSGYADGDHNELSGIRWLDAKFADDAAEVGLRGQIGSGVARDVVSVL